MKMKNFVLWLPQTFLLVDEYFRLFVSEEIEENRFLSDNITLLAM